MEAGAARGYRAESEPKFSMEAVAGRGCLDTGEFNALDGSASSYVKTKNFLEENGEKAAKAFLSPLDGSRARVVVMRHAMGGHNTYKGVGSMFHEDAELNDCGRAQAKMVGDYMRDAGILDALDIVIVSPFIRAMQTAAHALQDDLKRLKVVVEPMCGEHSFAGSHIGRGDRGSTAAEIRAQNPEIARLFDIDQPLAAYCLSNKIGMINPKNAGKWWHHGPHSHETEGSFHRRCMRFREKLGQLPWVADRPARVMVVSHGGVMEAAFGLSTTPPNCGFSVFDIGSDGSGRQKTTGNFLGPCITPAFEVVKVANKKEKYIGRHRKHRVYDIELLYNSTQYALAARQSALRACLHDVVKKMLKEEGYLRYKLNGKFPLKGCTFASINPALQIQDWLEQLSMAMGDCGFPPEVAGHVYRWMRGHVDPEQLQATHEFMGGEQMGFKLSEDGVVLEVNGGGQAEKNGVKVGDKVLKIGDKGYSPDVMQHMASLRSNYTITFQVSETYYYDCDFEPSFELVNVIEKAEKDQGSNAYEIQVLIAEETYSKSTTNNQMRAEMHDFIKKAISADIYQQYELAGHFPWAGASLRSKAPTSTRIRSYLESLAQAMLDENFPSETAEYIIRWLRGDDGDS